MEFLRLIKEVHLEELKCLVAAEMIVLHALYRGCRIVGFYDRVALLALDLIANFVSHVSCPIFPNGPGVNQRVVIAHHGPRRVDEYVRPWTTRSQPSRLLSSHNSRPDNGMLRWHKAPATSTCSKARSLRAAKDVVPSPTRLAGGLRQRLSRRGTPSS